MKLNEAVAGLQLDRVVKRAGIVLTASDVLATDWDVSAPVAGQPAPATPAPIPTPVQLVPVTPKITYVGVNIAGGEFSPDNTGPAGTAYILPTTGQIDYWASKGLKTIRLPFLSRRWPSDCNTIGTLISYAASKSVTVVLDLHQYGRMPSGLVGVDAVATADFCNFWGQLATLCKGKNNVIFGLMNEPNVQSLDQWWSAVSSAVMAITAVDPSRTILVPGTFWTGAEAWVNNGNAARFVQLKKNYPNARLIAEVHEYLDVDNSGTHAEAQPGKGATCLKAATEHARANGYQLWLGEVGWSIQAQAMTEANALLNHLGANADVWAGVTYWAAGAWWGGYMYSIEPANGQDKPQVAQLRSLL